MVTCRGRRRPFRRRRQDLPSFSIYILYASITTHFIYPHNNKQTSSLYMYTHSMRGKCIAKITRKLQIICAHAEILSAADTHREQDPRARVINWKIKHFFKRILFSYGCVVY